MLDSRTVKLTKDMTVEEFYDWHNRNTCRNDDHRDWAVANCQTMQECWYKLSPLRLIWVATCPGVLKPKEQRLFAIFCCREFWHLLPDERSRNSIEVAERYAFNPNEETREELDAAHVAAKNAIRTLRLPNDKELAHKVLKATRAAGWVSEPNPVIAVQFTLRTVLSINNTVAARNALRIKYANWFRKHTKPSFWFTPLSLEYNDD